MLASLEGERGRRDERRLPAAGHTLFRGAAAGKGGAIPNLRPSSASSSCNPAGGRCDPYLWRNVLSFKVRRRATLARFWPIGQVRFQPLPSLVCDPSLSSGRRLTFTGG